MTGNNNAPGIIPRAISEIFSIIEQTAVNESDVYFYVRLSYVELYNNNFRNLLQFATKDPVYRSSLNDLRASTGSFIDYEMNATPRSGRESTPTSPSRDKDGSKIEVRESQSAGVFLAGPNLRVPVTSAQEAFQLIAKGNKLRAVGSTQCNDVSSRSHAILTIHVESRYSTLLASTDSTDNLLSTRSSSNIGRTPRTDLRLGKMHLVDLAGSERLSMSGSEGEALVETQNINLSLSALGDVLSALSRNAMAQTQIAKLDSPRLGDSRSTSPRKSVTMSGLIQQQGSSTPTLVPVPYRNSKLTHLLKVW